MEEEGVKGKALCKRQGASEMENFTLSLSAQPREHGRQYKRSDSPPGRGSRSPRWAARRHGNVFVAYIIR